MRVTLLTPFYLPVNRGNALSVHRLVTSLRRHGERVQVINLQEGRLGKNELGKKVAFFAPHVLHGIHPFRTGEEFLSLLDKDPLPSVISCRGTDLSVNLKDRIEGQLVLKVLRRVDRIVVLTAGMEKEILNVAPSLKGKIQIIPHAVQVGNEPFSHPLLFPGRGREVVFLFPSNIRQIKNPLFPLSPLRALHDEFPEVRLAFAGPIVEKEVGKEFLQAIKPLDWVTYLGEVPHEQMASIMKKSHILINCSLAEGLSNALLEGMSLGRPPLASRTSGNESLIRDGKNGFLFSSPEEFLEKARLLVSDLKLRQKLGRAAKERVSEGFSPRAELFRYLALYRDAIEAYAPVP